MTLKDIEPKNWRTLPSAAIFTGVATVATLAVVGTVALTDGPSESLSSPDLRETEAGLVQKRTGAGTKPDGAVALSDDDVRSEPLPEDGEPRLSHGNATDLTGIEDPDAPTPEKNVSRKLEPSEAVTAPGAGEVSDHSGMVRVTEGEGGSDGTSGEDSAQDASGDGDDRMADDQGGEASADEG